MRRKATNLKPGDLFLVSGGLGEVTRLTGKRVYFRWAHKRKESMWRDNSVVMPGASVRGEYSGNPFVDIFGWRDEPRYVEVVRNLKMYHAAVKLSRELEKNVSAADAEAQRARIRRDAAVRAALRWR